MSASKKKSSKPVNEKELIEKALRALEERLGGDDVRGTWGDMLRLLERRKQLEEESPKDIRVTWIDDKSSE